MRPSDQELGLVYQRSKIKDHSQETLICRPTDADYAACARSQLLFADQRAWLQRLSNLLPEKRMLLLLLFFLNEGSDSNGLSPFKISEKEELSVWYSNLRLENPGLIGALVRHSQIWIRRLLASGGEKRYEITARDFGYDSLKVGSGPRTPIPGFLIPGPLCSCLVLARVPLRHVAADAEGGSAGAGGCEFKKIKDQKLEIRDLRSHMFFGTELLLRKVDQRCYCAR